MNWNTQCAWCHMSLFHKNYDPVKDRYASTWTEPGVTCIQCHGPLLDKPERRLVKLDADISLFTIPDHFVIGYGLDCGEIYRNLPYIAEYDEGEEA